MLKRTQGRISTIEFSIRVVRPDSGKRKPEITESMLLPRASGQVPNPNYEYPFKAHTHPLTHHIPRIRGPPDRCGEVNLRGSCIRLHSHSEQVSSMVERYLLHRW